MHGESDWYHMKDLYICTGKYHLFCSLMLKLIDNEERDGDLLICDCFEGAAELYRKIKTQGGSEEKLKTFDNVFLLSRERCLPCAPSGEASFFNKVTRVIKNQMRKEENRLSDILCDMYSRIYIAGAVFPLAEYCIWSHKHNGSEIMLFDDGLGSRLQGYKPALKARILNYNRVLDFYKSLKCKYFFSIDRVWDVYPHIPLVGQIKPTKSLIEKKGLSFCEIQTTINGIFGYNNCSDPIKKSDIVYLAAGFDLYGGLKKYSSTEVFIINYIGNKYKNFIVKRHPNSNEEYDSKIQCISEACMPEVSYFNADMENKLLISSGSASVFNPSFVFDKNPYIILTYKLFGNNGQLSGDLFGCSEKELYKKLEHTLFSGYKDPSKIYIPSTMQELLQDIDDYIKRSGGTK